MQIIIVIESLLLVLYLFTIYRYYHGISRLSRQSGTEERPSVSVVVCAHNEEKNLPICLELLFLQNYPRNKVEFIIVNDRSTDGTARIMESYARRDKRFKALHIQDRLEDFAPKKRAIDTAIGYAGGEIILLTDADGHPGQDWIATMISYYHEDTDMVLGYAPYQVEKSDPPSKKILALEYLSHAAVSCAGTGLGYPLTCVGTNMSYRKRVYRELGGFGEYKSIVSGDDDLFLTRVRDAGVYKIAYAGNPKAHVYNAPPSNFKQFIHQRIRYASKGLDYPAPVTLGLTLYFIFYLILFLGLTLGALSKTIWAVSLTVLFIKALADFIFMNKAAAFIGDRRFLHWMPLAEILHIPYVLIFGILGQLKQYEWADATPDRKSQG